MAVKYALYENQMTGDPEDCMAVVQHDAQGGQVILRVLENVKQKTIRPSLVRQ